MFFFFGNLSLVTDELWLAACKGNHMNVVELILRGDSPVGKESRRMCTPLHVACMMGHIETVLVLLHAHEMVSHWRNASEQGNMAGLIDVVGQTTSSRGRHTMNSVPRQIQNLISQEDKDGKTPIYYACGGLRPRVVELLIAYGADISSLTGVGRNSFWRTTPVDVAANGSIYKFKDNDIRRDNSSPTRLDARMEVVQILLGAGAIIRQVPFCSFDQTIWQSAIEEHPSTKLLDLLLQRNVAIPLFQGGKSILHKVATLQDALSEDGNDVLLARMLVAYGLDPFHRDNDGCTPMYDAVRLCNPELFRYFFSLLLKTEGYTRDTLNEYRCVSNVHMWEEMLRIENELRDEAFAMGQDPRLGRDSWARLLDPELSRLIREY
jgi:hypothetical protein